MKGNYTVFLFDLLEDPYETTNLFDEPDDDGLYEMLTNAMYDQLSEYKKNSKISYGIESMNKAAKNAWRQQVHYIYRLGFGLGLRLRLNRYTKENFPAVATCAEMHFTCSRTINSNLHCSPGFISFALDQRTRY